MMPKNKSICILCNTKQYKKLFTVGRYSIVQCVNCGLVRTVGTMQVDYSHYERDTEYSSLDNYFKNIFQKRFNIISRYKQKPGKILDIGASTGVLLRIFRDSGWETWGVEPSAAAKIAESKNIKIVQTNFEKAELPKEYFDVVVMNHTLEHVQNPLLVLKKINSVLKKGGLVYIDVPNFGSLSSRLAGKNWKYLHPYEHIHHFTSVSLTSSLKAAGFEVSWVKTWSGIFDVANPLLKFWQTLVGLKKQFFTDMIEIPGNIIATAMNKGTSLAALGKKK